MKKNRLYAPTDHRIHRGRLGKKDLDDLVSFYEKRDIPLAINHCVSLYPSEDSELGLDQIDYLKRRYPNHVIGYSTHEYHDWFSSMLISYGKGARSWERHIDINYEDVAVSPYCSLPENCDTWFKAFHKAKEMCGGVGQSRRVISKREKKNIWMRWCVAPMPSATWKPVMYSAKKLLKKDFYLAIPLHKGQLSCREVMNGEKLLQPIKANDRLTIDIIDGHIAKTRRCKA